MFILCFSFGVARVFFFVGCTFNLYCSLYCFLLQFPRSISAFIFIENASFAQIRGTCHKKCLFRYRSFYLSRFYCCNSVSLLSIFIEIVFDSTVLMLQLQLLLMLPLLLFIFLCVFHAILPFPLHTLLFRYILNRFINSTIVFFFSLFIPYDTRYSYTDSGSVSVKVMYGCLFIAHYLN